MAQTKAKKTMFKAGEHVVYPSHGVGKILNIESQEIAGLTLDLIVVKFEKEKMILRVPTTKAESVGMRKLASKDTMDKALKTLAGRARIKRVMWSRRAQEYEAKINSGDLIAISEVLRDLYKAEGQPEQSYSERQLFEAAKERMVRELALIAGCTDNEADTTVEDNLKKSPKKRVSPKADNTDTGSAEEKVA